MRLLAAVLLAGVLAGCTSVKMVQRDGCWVRRTEKRFLGTIAEEVGPCAGPATAYVENDPLTRLVQECVARADHRWQMRALVAFDRREPWPEQLSEASVLQQCMDDSARRLAGEANALKEKNAALEQRLAEMAEQQRALQQENAEERRSLLRRSDEDRQDFFRRGDEQRRELLALQAKLGDHLGDAAKKVHPLPPPAVATATATSEGRSRTEGGAGAPPQPPAVVLVTPPAAQASGPVSASATFAPGGSLPAACVVQPERAARAEAPVKKAGPSRQARTPDRSDARRKQVAASELPGCDPARTAQVVQAGQAAQGAQAAATNGEPPSMGPAADPRPTAAMAASPAPTPPAASPATDAGAVEPATAPGPGAPAAAALSEGDGEVVETVAEPSAAR